MRRKICATPVSHREFGPQRPIPGFNPNGFVLVLADATAEALDLATPIERWQGR
jgi:hypothetical protein